MNIDDLACCKNIVDISLFRCDELTDTHALQFCTKLKKLELSGCHKLKKVCGPDGLEHIELFSLNRITNLSSLSNCTLLKKVVLNSLPNLSDISFLFGCQNIHTTRILNCNMIQSMQ